MFFLVKCIGICIASTTIVAIFISLPFIALYVPFFFLRMIWKSRFKKDIHFTLKICLKHIVKYQRNYRRQIKKRKKNYSIQAKTYRSDRNKYVKKVFLQAISSLSKKINIIIICKKIKKCIQQKKISKCTTCNFSSMMDFFLYKKKLIILRYIFFHRHLKNIREEFQSQKKQYRKERRNRTIASIKICNNKLLVIFDDRIVRSINSIETHTKHLIFKFNERRSFYLKNIFLAVILLVGIISQIILNINNSPCIQTNNLENVTATTVAIQATLFTLIISLLALVTNKDERIFGFEIKKFYFTYSTLFWTQKQMMYAGIFSIFFNTALLYLQCEAIVFSIFLISLWLIFESVRNVMRIFAGTNGTYKEDVENYIFDCLKKKQDIDTMYKNFTDDWISKIPSQSKAEYNSYFAIYQKFLKHII